MCVITEVSSSCFDVTPCLLREYTVPVSLHHEGFFKALVLGQIFLCQPSVLCGTLLELFVCFLQKNKSQLGLVKNQRQQRCDNPRVKGVNMRREFHAWQVCRMAPVFSLFTHANEQYADEQTWAQPRLPAAQNWQKACCVAPLPPHWSLLCVAVSGGFYESDALVLCTVSRLFMVSLAATVTQRKISSILFIPKSREIASYSYSLKLHMLVKHSIVVDLSVVRNLQ